MSHRRSRRNAKRRRQVWIRRRGGFSSESCCGFWVHPIQRSTMQAVLARALSAKRFLDENESPHRQRCSNAAIADYAESLRE